jgi:peptide/nickel transport system permease protein
MGVLIIGAVLTLLGNLLADVSYALADPRLRRR